MRRVSIAVGGRGGMAGEIGKEAELIHGDSAAAALGMWVYAHRDELGLEIELITAHGRGVSKPQRPPLVEGVLTPG